MLSRLGCFFHTAFWGCFPTTAFGLSLWNSRSTNSMMILPTDSIAAAFSSFDAALGCTSVSSGVLSVNIYMTYILPNSTFKKHTLACHSSTTGTSPSTLSLPLYEFLCILCAPRILATVSWSPPSSTWLKWSNCRENTLPRSNQELCTSLTGHIFLKIIKYFYHLISFVFIVQGNSKWERYGIHICWNVIYAMMLATVDFCVISSE